MNPVLFQIGQSAGPLQRVGCRASLLGALLGLSVVATAVAGDPPPIQDPAVARVERVLEKTPIIDGHNDLAWQIRDLFKSDFNKADLRKNTSALAIPADATPLMTDLPRLHAGHVGAQFWSVWIPADTKGAEAVKMTIEQIDLVKRMAATYPADLSMAYSASDIRRIVKQKRIASLIGVEGGHQIDGSLAVLRAYYDLGARYMTLTHSSNIAWADSATDVPLHHGLTPFGKEVVREMNRLGMVVDLSHVSADTMRSALETTVAPVMFSHSSARAISDHPRNVSDEVLRLLAQNDGVVMVNFYPEYVSETRRHWASDQAAEKARFSSPPFGGLYIGQPDRAKAALDAWNQAHPKPPVTIADVADNIEYIRRVAGIDHVGLGSDFDGIPEAPTGLDGVDKYPAILIELAHRGWSDEDLEKVSANNILRVLSATEAVSARLRADHLPSTARIEELDAAAANVAQ